VYGWWPVAALLVAEIADKKRKKN